MRFLVFSVALACAACARAPIGGWPSLALRPAESSAAAAAAGAPAESADGDIPGAGALVLGQPLGSAATRVDVAARLASAVRDLDAAEARWRAQQTATSGAVQRARGASQGEPAWAAAQLELSRLEQAGAAFADIRATLNALAGHVASEAASGGSVPAASLGSVGRAIGRARSDGELHARELANLRAAAASR